MKRIAISQRVDIHADRDERRDALDQRLSAFVTAIGALAFPVPNGLQEQGRLREWLDALSPDGILLSGGNDVGGQPDRDGVERMLLNWSTERRLPVLGICRGMQMMASAAGGRLKRVTGHVRTRHVLDGVLVGTVNSFHDHALDGCPASYRVLAVSEDGSIEAIRHEDLPFEGWMWHPERETPFADTDLERARKLFSA